jgi:DNA helicase-2/ATP-dependent DNA helicase PcrA
VRVFEPPAAAVAEWAGFVELFRAMHKSRGGSTRPAEVGLAKRWYLPQLDRLHDDAEARRADVENLERVASGYADRERFLTELTLDPPDATSDQTGPPGRDEDYAILSTLHSAKGQEWKAVFVLRAVDGCRSATGRGRHGAELASRLPEERHNIRAHRGHA